MEPFPGGIELMVASLWGMRCVDDLDFFFISHTPTDSCIPHTSYPPISPVPLHVPYFPELPPCLYIFSTLFGAACPSPIQGLVIIIYLNLMCQTCLVVCLLYGWLDLVLCIVYLVSLAECWVRLN